MMIIIIMDSAKSLSKSWPRIILGARQQQVAQGNPNFFMAFIAPEPFSEFLLCQGERFFELVL